jgi:hypothetical protein
MNKEEIFKEVIDYLSPLQTPTEQAIYNYLLRWSYFETGKNIIQIGERTIAKEVSKPAKGKLSKSKGLSYSTVRDCIRDLIKKGHLEISEIHHKGKVYKIKLPSEIKSSLELKGEKNKTPKDKLLSEDYYKNPANRKIIFERDSSKCFYCGQKVNENNATLDHKIPLSKGGTNSKDNLVVCCFECNSIKSGKTFEEVAPKLLERLKNKINH